MCDSCFYGPYASLRAKLDFTYHANYTEERQSDQDKLVTEVLSSGVPSDKPWIVYTAGAMGVGKSWTMRWLQRNGYFPLNYFVHIDPDALKCMLPEMETYIKQNPEMAATLTHKESGYIAEVAEAAALANSFHVLVDGSLRDADWYIGVFKRIREQYPHYRIGILHVIAAPAKVYRRAEKRSRKTGRVVPKHVLDASIFSVPRSVQQLAPYADFVAEVNLDRGTPCPLTMPWAQLQAAFASVTEDAVAAGRASASSAAAGMDDDDEFDDDEEEEGGSGGGEAADSAPGGQAPASGAEAVPGPSDHVEGGAVETPAKRARHS
ncbi:unnamed protein product [Symbiodinium sp. KB8]|nr:unnamed protein product [Symbiodinium sp. KB8]